MLTVNKIHHFFILMAAFLCYGVVDAEEVRPNLQLYQRPENIPFPADNPYTPEKVALGKKLFFDTRLSRDQNISCASCHNPSFGWEVPFARAIGAGGKPLGRQAPSNLNLAWSAHFFWDGRANSLEQQASGPIQAPMEMDIKLVDLVKRLKQVNGYINAFNISFPNEGLTADNILKAIGVYERTLISGEAPFDRWLAGDQKAVSDSAKRGYTLFNSKARCVSCHRSWNFTDDQFHDIGLPVSAQKPDIGRAKISSNEVDKFAFKTPGLREISQRAPYMHDGSVKTLTDVVRHYASGVINRPTLSKQMPAKIDLSEQEIADLVNFMKTLTSDHAMLSMPNLPAN